MTNFNTGNDTEADILSNHIDMAIEAQDGGNSASTETTTEDNGGQTATQQANTDNSAADGSQSAASAGGGANDASQQQAETEQQKAQAGDPNKSGQQQQQQEKLNPGDLRLSDGTIVRSGVERRFYETAQQLRIVNKQQADALERFNNETTQLKAQIEAYKQSNTADAQYGLTPEESVTARQMLAKYKTDPMGTLRFLLAETAAAGHNLSDLVPGLDGAAMQRMLDQRLAPIVGQNRSPEREAQEWAAGVITQFYNKYPDAQQHDEHLAAIITKHQCSPEEAYYALRDQIQKAGLDWYQPLGPQVKALKERQAAQQSATQTQSAQQQQPQPPAMPSGRPGTGGQVTDTPVVAHESSEWDDIIRSTMREQGMLK